MQEVLTVRLDMWFVLKVLFTAGMSSKRTAVKVNSALSPFRAINSPFRLCRATGDPNHRKNLFKPSKRALLSIAEQICVHPIVYETNLPHLARTSLSFESCQESASVDRDIEVSTRLRY